MRSLVAVTVVVLSVAACSPARGVEITGFRSGLACPASPQPSGANGWICHVTEDILLTDQGECLYANEPMRCTWVGFEFDYRGAKQGDKLDCIEETSRPTTHGNPEAEIAKDKTAQPFSIPLEAGSGHLYNPQYFIYETHAPGDAPLQIEVACTIGGKPAIAYTMRIHYPERAAP
jgi:hypothetical protein